MPYVGYHESRSLPIKQGQTVIVPKGTPVKSTHPTRKQYLSKRQQTVKVHHLTPGQTISVGTVRHDGYFRWSVNDRDLVYIAEQLGLPYGTKTEQTETQDKIMKISIQNKVPVGNGSTAFVAMVPVKNPSITWPGTGGYWCEVDINAVLANEGPLSLLPVSAGGRP